MPYNLNWHCALLASQACLTLNCSRIPLRLPAQTSTVSKPLAFGNPLPRYTQQMAKKKRDSSLLGSSWPDASFFSELGRTVSVWCSCLFPGCLNILLCCAWWPCPPHTYPRHRPYCTPRCVPCLGHELDNVRTRSPWR